MKKISVLLIFMLNVRFSSTALAANCGFMLRIIFDYIKRGVTSGLKRDKDGNKTPVAQRGGMYTSFRATGISEEL